MCIAVITIGSEPEKRLPRNFLEGRLCLSLSMVSCKVTHSAF
jgi:hypothetical protein